MHKFLGKKISKLWFLGNGAPKYALTHHLNQEYLGKSVLQVLKYPWAQEGITDLLSLFPFQSSQTVSRTLYQALGQQF